MWREASILLSFAVGMTLVYAGFERLFAGRRAARGSDGEVAKARGALTRAALTGVVLALLGALTVYAGVYQLTRQ
jgi:hypothetical protein